MRLVGWRGAKAKRQRTPNPLVVAAVRQAVKDRIAEQEAETEVESEAQPE
jgi:hypothetical protein